MHMGRQLTHLPSRGQREVTRVDAETLAVIAQAAVSCMIRAMANVKKGQLVPAGEWWKHLRWAKRVFWKRQRKADQREAAAQRADG